MAGAASQAGDADSSRAPGLISGLQGVHECPPWCSIVGATVTVHRFFCILHYLHNPSKKSTPQRTSNKVTSFLVTSYLGLRSRSEKVKN